MKAETSRATATPILLRRVANKCLLFPIVLSSSLSFYKKRKKKEERSSENAREITLRLISHAARIIRYLTDTRVHRGMWRWKVDKDISERFN